MAILAYPHQKTAFQELVFRAQTYFSNQWHALPVRPRFHSLLVGPTGTGKSSLLDAVAVACGAHLVRVSCPGWLPLSGRESGARETFPLILEVSCSERTRDFVSG
jgi:SpoVK/Ycf46/Vps4 family AAA+-type ATPase